MLPVAGKRTIQFCVFNHVSVFSLVDSMYKNITSFFSAYWKNYNAQHVMLKFLEEWREKLDKNYVVGGILMDLLKTFYCVPHYFLLAKHAAYDLDESFHSYKYSYLLNRKQYVPIKNINIYFLNIIYNHFHNILRLFDVLPSFSVTTSETMGVN